MIHIAMKTKGAFDRSTLLSINRPNSQTFQMRAAQTAPIHTTPAYSAQAASPPPVRTAPMRIPSLVKPIQKGQKVSIETAAPLRRLKACFGWNTLNPQCDVDVSAFLLGENGKVLGDSWFVFYGQTESPDKSTIFHEDSGTDRESVTIDLKRLNPAVRKIVFVLTINEAFEHKLHFGMLKDAYIRILNGDTAAELASFQMTEYYSNVISMMIGEIYRHNGAFKFNAVGNGVARDLEGLCDLYGVQVID